MSDADSELLMPAIPMPAVMQQDWRDRYCRRQASILWGKKRVITPELVPIVYGDGLQALAVRPIITRLSHYIIAIDSGVKIESGGFHYAKDQVYADIEELFGQCHCQECGGDAIPGDDTGWEMNRRIFAQWPTPCLSMGTEWWLL